jgi:hypothetical protein
MAASRQPELALGLVSTAEDSYRNILIWLQESKLPGEGFGHLDWPAWRPGILKPDPGMLRKDAFSGAWVYDENRHHFLIGICRPRSGTPAAK